MVDDPHCRAAQPDRVLTAVKARRCAPPPLRGADGLDTGCAHGRQTALARQRRKKFPLQVAVDAEHPIFVAGRLHAPREILVRGRRDPSDRGEDLGEPGSPVPTRLVTGFILLPGRLHAPREILVRGRRDLSDHGEDLGEPGSPVPTRVVTGFIPIQGRDADQQPHGSSSASNGTQGQAALSHRHWRQAPRIDPFRSDTRKKGGHALTC